MSPGWFSDKIGEGEISQLCALGKKTQLMSSYFCSKIFSVANEKITQFTLKHIDHMASLIDSKTVYVETAVKKSETAYSRSFPLFTTFFFEFFPNYGGVSF